MSNKRSASLRGVLRDRRHQRPVWVVKLSRGLFETTGPQAWLQALCVPPAGPEAPAVVIVPGAGPFVDAVRAMQGRIGFSDAAAHHMLLLAMEQYAVALLDLEPRLRIAGNADELARLRAEGKPAVWLPLRMVLGWHDVPRSQTADALAAWLAGELGASHLVLVKPAVLTSGTAAVERLTDEGVLDISFAAQLRRFHGTAWCVGQAAHNGFAAAMAQGEVAGGVRLVLDEAPA